ncbi:MAG TPA: gephyrin-like molybdotransferase receptor GlpR, partial [Streptomyces sp.]|nr:gephyrin-like molybdotransferase receptor GlpR [Streptomyces sp.]
MSSSGLIYAVIVGAWAAYLVPMWLRRQDELNEARPTERFSTAIRLLSGRAGMERRYARDLQGTTGSGANGPAGPGAAADDDVAGLPADGGAGAAAPGTGIPDGVDGVDVRALANPVTGRHGYGEPPPPRSEAPTEVHPRPMHTNRSGHADRADHPGRPGHFAHPVSDRSVSVDPDRTDRNRRAKLLARRRRTTMVLFLAFTLGAIIAAVGGIAFLWAPAIPAGLLSAYIAHLRAQERRRFAFVMDQRRAEAAARRLRERHATAAEPPRTPLPEPAPSPEAADRRALVEQTDHAEWVDSQRGERAPGPVGGGWEPTPVPLPTYVNAPVAPRTAHGVDLGAPDTWSSARST